MMLRLFFLFVGWEVLGDHWGIFWIYVLVVIFWPEPKPERQEPNFDKPQPRSQQNPPPTGAEIEHACRLAQFKKDLAVFGYRDVPPWIDIHRAYRRMVMTRHPDRGGNEEAWKAFQGAYDRLEKLLNPK